MTLTNRIDKDEKRFCQRNSELITKAARFRKDSFIDITSGIECNALLKKHGIENTSELIDFVQQLPADHFPDSRKPNPKTAGIALTVVSLLLSLLVASCLEAEWIEQAFPALAALIAAVISGLLVFGIFELKGWLNYRRRRTRAQKMIQLILIFFMAFLTGVLVWQLHPDASVFTADTFHLTVFVLRVVLFVSLSACLLRICRFPFVDKTVGEVIRKSVLLKTGLNLLGTIRLYPFRDELFALCNHAKLIQILDRTEEKKTRREEAPMKMIHIEPPHIQPAWLEPASTVQPRKQTVKKPRDEGIKELKDLYMYREKQRAALDEARGSLTSTFVLKHKAKRTVWSLIDHGEMPIVFVLSAKTEKNQFAEEVISSLALFNPPELIDQIVNDPLHNALYFTGYENTVSVINDINQLWKTIHESMAKAAQRQLIPGQSVDEINSSLFEQHENPEGFIRWKVVHFLEPHMSIRINDLQISEDGQQYGFIPVFYFTDEEWNEDSEITEYLSSCDDLAVYSITETGITSLNEEV